MNIEEFKKNPVMGILRGATLDVIESLVESVTNAGLKTIEVTMNTKDALLIIKKIFDVAKGKLNIGAGTVLSLDDMHKALNAGASFIVSPTLITDIVKYCNKKNIPVFPGAFTPQEIYNAWHAGATMVKVFPAKLAGPEYFKEIKGPFQDIELLACGGVSSDNIRSYFNNGAAAIAFGSSIFKKEWLQNKQLKKIEDDIKLLIANLR